MSQSDLQQINYDLVVQLLQWLIGLGSPSHEEYVRLKLDVPRG